MLFDQLLPAATIFRPTFKHGVPQVDILGVCDGCLFWCNGCIYNVTVLILHCSIDWPNIRKRGSKIPHQIPSEFNSTLLIM